MARLGAWTQLHCEWCNAALDERIDAWRKASKSISYDEQQNVLPQIKADRPEFITLGSRALQQALRRLDLAFAAFFCRLKAGQTPGFARFKSSKRFSGFPYPDPARCMLMEYGRPGATLRIGIGEAAISIRARGRHRFGPDAKPNDITLTRRNGQWFVSVTLRVLDAACARQRTGDLRRGGISGSTTVPHSTMDRPSRTRARCVRNCRALPRCNANASESAKDRCATSG